MSENFSIEFKSRFVNLLPGDSKRKNFCRQVFYACYSKVKPARVANPQIISYSREVVDLLDLPSDWMQSREAADTLGGNHLMSGMDPYAM